MDHELRQGRVERVVRERELLGLGRCTSTPGWRSRTDATNDADGSTADTDEAPKRSANSPVSAPVPQPTSSARWPSATPARSASWGARRTEYLPMNES